MSEVDYIHVGTKKIEDKRVCKLLLQKMIMCINYPKDYKHVFNQVKDAHFHKKENAVYSKKQINHLPTERMQISFIQVIYDDRSKLKQ